MDDYKTLDHYLGPVDPEVRKAATAIFDLGKSVPKAGLAEKMYDYATSKLAGKAIADYANGQPIRVDSIRYTSVIATSIDDNHLTQFMRTLVGALNDFCGFAISQIQSGEKSNQAVIDDLKLVMGAYFFGRGMDVSSFEDLFAIATQKIDTRPSTKA